VFHVLWCFTFQRVRIVQSYLGGCLGRFEGWLNGKEGGI